MSNRTTSELPVRRYGVKGELPKLLDRLRSFEDRAAETHEELTALERRRSELPNELAAAERDALLAGKAGPDDATERLRDLEAELEAARSRHDGARQAVSETRRQVEAELAEHGADLRATVREEAAKRRDDALDALGDTTEALSAFLDAAATIAGLAPVPGTRVGGIVTTDAQRRTRMDRFRRHEVARKLEEVRRELAAIDLSDPALDLGPRNTGTGTLRVAG